MKKEVVKDLKKCLMEANCYPQFIYYYYKAEQSGTWRRLLHKKCETANNYRYVIMNGFSWHETQEGERFWAKLYNKNII